MSKLEMCRTTGIILQVARGQKTMKGKAVNMHIASWPWPWASSLWKSKSGPSFFVLLVVTGSQVPQASLKLTLWPKMTLNV